MSTEWKYVISLDVAHYEVVVIASIYFFSKHITFINKKVQAIKKIVTADDAKLNPGGRRGGGARRWDFQFLVNFLILVRFWGQESKNLSSHRNLQNFILRHWILCENRKYKPIHIIISLVLWPEIINSEVLSSMSCSKPQNSSQRLANNFLQQRVLRTM